MPNTQPGNSSQSSEDTNFPVFDFLPATYA